GSLPDLDRHLDLAGDDLRLDGVDLLHVGRGDARADLPEAHPAVLEVEDEVLPADERACHSGLDREVDAAVDALDSARQDVLAEVGLVLVNADAPDAGPLRGVQ